MSAASRAATYRARRDAEIERLKRIEAAARALLALTATWPDGPGVLDAIEALKLALGRVSR